jgi:hypothetical protein
VKLNRLATRWSVLMPAIWGSGARGHAITVWIKWPQSKVKPGLVPMMLRTPTQAGYSMQQVRGLVIGDWGTAQVKGEGWSITYLPNGKSVKCYIKRKRDAVNLLVQIASATKGLDFSDESLRANPANGLIVSRVIDQWKEGEKP